MSKKIMEDYVLHALFMEENITYESFLNFIEIIQQRNSVFSFYYMDDGAELNYYDLTKKTLTRHLGFDYEDNQTIIKQIDSPLEALNELVSNILIKDTYVAPIMVFKTAVDTKGMDDFDNLVKAFAEVMQEFFGLRSFRAASYFGIRDDNFSLKDIEYDFAEKDSENFVWLRFNPKKTN